MDKGLVLAPDLVLTDIRMPEMDGLEFIEKLKEILPECVFVILSGYDDFEYARQAISLGVSHYILKPLQKNEFSQVMTDCIQKCRKVQMRLLEEQRIKDRLDRATPALRDNYILNIINGMVQPDMDKLTELEIDIQNRFYVVSGVKFSDSTKKTLSYKRLFILKEILQKAIEEVCASNVRFYTLIDYSTVRFILSFADCSGYKEILKDIAARLEEDIKTFFDEELIFGAGSPVDDLGGISDSAAEADRVLEYKNLQCNKDVLFIDDLANTGPFKPVLFTLSERKKLYNSVSQCDTEEIHKLFRRLKEQLAGMNLIPPGYLHFVFMDLIITVARNLAENGFQMEDVYDMKIFSYDFFASFKSLDELVTWAENIFINVAKSFAEYKVSKPRKAIEDIKQYIMRNIQGDINLTHISQVFYYNPSYISRIFKEELNMNFSSFVIEQKMEYAAKLLLETDLKLYEVCEKVGYSGYKHFTSVFKKIKGVTLSEFKKQGCTSYEF